jgi:hypothetical protein
MGADSQLQEVPPEDRDAVLMETVISLVKQQRHCMIECIPVPFEVSNKAPMYFKKVRYLLQYCHLHN